MLSVLSVAPSDTRDGQGRPRFLPVPPSVLHQPSARLRLRPLWEHSAYPLTEVSDPPTEVSGQLTEVTSPLTEVSSWAYRGQW